MNIITSVAKAVDEKVKNKNDPFLMMGQSCVEWIRSVNSNDNFVPELKALRFIERINVDASQKTTNLINFQMTVTNVFENSIFSQTSNANEKKYPTIEFYIGKDALNEIKASNPVEEKNIDVKKLIVYINVDDADCTIDQNNVSNWNTPIFHSLDNLNIIEAKSSQVIYFGYLYMLAVAEKYGFNTSIVLGGNFTVEKTIEIIIEYIGLNHPI